MATKNIRIVGYLQPDYHQKLRDYMAEQSLTESAALAKIIKQFFTRIALPAREQYRPRADALQWHRQNFWDKQA
jgi:predicted restriction endonuclease